MKEMTIMIKGMHCPSCETLLTDVLQDVSGVKMVHVSLKETKAHVTYDATLTDEAALRKAIEAEGYKTA